MNIILEAALRRYAVAHKAKNETARNAAMALVLRIIDTQPNPAFP